MRWKYLLALLRTLKIPGLLPVMKDWRSFVRMHFLYAALEAGLLEALRTPLGREELGRRLETARPEILDALLDVGLALKELARAGGLYRLKGKRSRALLEGQGDILAAMIQAHVTYYHSAYCQAAARLRGAPLGDDLGRIGGLVARFAKIGEPLLGEFLQELAAGQDPLRVLDVGCGSGVFLRSISQANPQASGVGLDLDGEVVAQASRNLAAWRLGERFKIIEGDILAPPPGLEGPFNLILLFNLLYYFPHEQRLALLSGLRSLLAPQGVIAVAMNLQSQGQDLAAANLNLANSSLQGLTPLPSLEEITGQLKESGFAKIEAQRLVPGGAFYGIVAGVA